MDYLKLIAVLFLAIGVSKYIDELFKKTKVEINENKKIFLYVYLVILCVVVLILFYGVMVLVRSIYTF